MGQGQGAARAPPPPPPPPPPPSSEASGALSPWLHTRAQQAKRKATVWTETGRRLWHHGDVHRAGQRVQRRMNAQMHVLKENPMESAIAIAAGAGCGALLFATGRVSTSFALQSLRVSSQNHVAATIGGGVGFVMSSTAAAQGFLIGSTLVAERRGVQDWPLLPVSPGSPSFVALTGCCGLLSFLQFRALRGRLRLWAPSDIIRSGSFAGASLPPNHAPGNDYADQAMKRLLGEQGGRFGCHTCGRSRSWLGLGPRLSFIGDHIPPNKYAKLADAASGAADSSLRAGRAWWFRLLPFLRPRKTPQVFLPQCERCSLIQSNAVRTDRRTLVAPRSWRWRDLWFPFPVWLTLLALPAFQELVERWEAEQRGVEREARRWT